MKPKKQTETQRKRTNGGTELLEGTKDKMARGNPCTLIITLNVKD